MVAHRDDEGKSVPRSVSGVQFSEPGAFGIGERVESGAGLFTGRFGGQALGRGQLAGKIGVGTQDGAALVLCGGAEGTGKGAVQASLAIMSGAKLQLEGALGHPRVWLQIPHEQGWIECPYCDAKFIHREFEGKV